jgi:hypothetical protein
MTNRIDPSVDTVKAAPGQPCLDGSRVEAQLDQLPKGHNPVLPLGQFGDLPITWM